MKDTTLLSDKEILILIEKLKQEIFDRGTNNNILDFETQVYTYNMKIHDYDNDNMIELITDSFLTQDPEYHLNETDRSSNYDIEHNNFHITINSLNNNDKKLIKKMRLELLEMYNNHISIKKEYIDKKIEKRNILFKQELRTLKLENLI